MCVYISYFHFALGIIPVDRCDRKHTEAIIFLLKLNTFSCGIILKTRLLLFSLQSKKGGKDQNRYNQVPHLTKDTTWESVENTIKNHKRESRGQPFPSR